MAPSGGRTNVLTWVVGLVLGIAYGLWAAPAGAFIMVLLSAFMVGVTQLVTSMVTKAKAAGLAPTDATRRADAQLRAYQIVSGFLLPFALSCGLVAVIRWF